MWADSHLTPLAPIVTIEQARNYQGWMERSTGQPFVVFHVPDESYAFDLGYRFHVQPADQWEELLELGAEIVPETQTLTSGGAV